MTALEARPQSPLAHLLGSDRGSLIVVMDYTGDTSIEDLIQGEQPEDAEPPLVGHASAIGGCTGRAARLSARSALLEDKERIGPRNRDRRHALKIMEEELAHAPMSRVFLWLVRRGEHERPIRIHLDDMGEWRCSLHTCK